MKKYLLKNEYLYILLLGVIFYFIQDTSYFTKDEIQVLKNVYLPYYIFWILSASILLAIRKMFELKENGIFKVSMLFCTITLYMMYIIKDYSKYTNKYMKGNLDGYYMFAIIFYIVTLILYIHACVNGEIFINYYRLRRGNREIKLILISSVIMLVVVFLMKIRDLILIIVLFDNIYLFLGSEEKVIDRIKKILIPCMLLGTILYGYSYKQRDGKKLIEVKFAKDIGYDDSEVYENDKEKNLEELRKDIKNKTGICYIKENKLKKLICGEVVKGKEEGKWIYWYENRKKESEGMYKNGKKVGKWIEWDRDGHKVREGVYVDGKKDGEWEVWNNNLFIYESGIYKDGKREGKWIGKYSNGKIAVECSYKNGEKVGKEIHWYESGKKSLLIDLDEKKDGKRIEWYESGKKLSECRIKNGKPVGKKISWYESGKKAEETLYKDREIILLSWYESGAKKEEEFYKDEKPEGNWIEWYENGQKKSEEFYKDGEREGRYIDWYENGQKEFDGIYRNGKGEGRHITWYENGNKYVEIIYQNGEKEKIIKYYKNGKKKLEVIYEDGKEVKKIEYDENGKKKKRWKIF